MRKRNVYQLPIRDITSNSQEFTFKIADEFFAQREESEIRAGVADATFMVHNVGSMFRISLNVIGEVVVACDRCLDDLTVPIDANYEFAVRMGDGNDEQDDVYYLAERDNAFDISDILYDTILLALPIVRYHEEGECNQEMAGQLRKYAEHDEDNGEEDSQAVDPRWEALKKLKNDNN